MALHLLGIIYTGKEQGLLGITYTGKEQGLLGITYTGKEQGLLGIIYTGKEQGFFVIREGLIVFHQLMQPPLSENSCCYTTQISD